MLEIAANPIDQAESTTLDNGLRVVSATMPNTQAVSYAVLINAGSRFESSAQAGISHFIEHLVFKGTRRWPTPRAISEADRGSGWSSERIDREGTGHLLVQGPGPAF